MFDKLDAIEGKYRELESLISDPTILADMPRWQKYSQEHAALSEIVSKYRDYKRVIRELKENKAMLTEEIDDEFKQLLETEIVSLEISKESFETELPILLLPKDPNDNKNVIIEIRGGVGGEEV